MAFNGFNLAGASAIYYGSTPVREVWKGSTKIWPNVQPLVGVPTITDVYSGYWGLGSPDDTGWMANVNFNEVQGAISYTCHFGNLTHTITQSEVEQIGFGSTGDFYTYPYVGGDTVNVYMTATNGVSTVSSSTVSHYIDPSDGPVVGNDIYISISVDDWGNITWQSSDIIYTGAGFGPQTFYLSPIVIERYGANTMTITGATGSITIYDQWSHTPTDHGSCGTVSGWPDQPTVARVTYGGAVCTSASSGYPAEWYDDDGNRVAFALDVPYSDLNNY